MSVFGGINRGISQGMEDNARRRKEKRVVRQQQRQELMTEINSITALMNNKNVPDAAKKDLWNGRYSDTMEKLFGKPIVPEITDWEKSLGQFVKESNDILHDPKLKRQERKQMYSSLSKAAGNDPNKLAVMEKGMETLTEQAFDNDVMFLSGFEGRDKSTFTDEEMNRVIAMKKQPNIGKIGKEVQDRFRAGARGRQGQEALGIRKEELGFERTKFGAKQAAGQGRGGLTPTVQTEIAGQTDPQVRGALDRVQQGKIDVAKAGVIAKAEAESDLPIPTNELVKFVDQNGHFPPANLTPNQAEELGFFPISESMKKQVMAVGNVGDILKEMNPLVNRLFTAEGFWDRVTGAFPNLQAYFLQEGDEQKVIDASFYEALKYGVAGQFAKTVSGEGGRLTDQDIQRVIGLFPTFFNSAFLSDTKKVASRKMEFLEKRMESERNRILKREGVKPKGKMFKAASKTPAKQSSNNISSMSNDDLMRELNK